MARPVPPSVREALVPRHGLEPTARRNLSVLYAGYPKSGKTHNMASWPNPLALCTDKNLATIQKFGIDYITVPDWLFYHEHVFPLLQRREWYISGSSDPVPFPYRTVFFDTATSLSDMLLEQLTQREALDGWKLWDAMLTRFMSAMRHFVNLATPTATHPGCHVLVGCHLRDKENESGNVVRTTLDISGRSSNHLPKFFDTSVLCRSEIVRTQSPSSPSRPERADYFVYTLNPSRLIDFVGDGVGGAGKPVLPPRVGGTYPELMAAWQLPTEDPNPS